MRRDPLVTDEIYHIYNRGVEKRMVFIEDTDYLRMVHNLFEFNDANPPLNLNYHFTRQSSEIGFPKIKREPRKLLVDLLAFCLMPNHYHLLVRQRIDGGITMFMRKLGVGYTNFFNEKYDRVGPLFQGKFKSILISQENHFIHLPYYIHLNPLDTKFPKWREQKIKFSKKALKFLENYRWSSHLDYCGKKNFPSVTQRKFLINFFGNPQKYKKEIKHWLKEIDMESLQTVILE